MDRKQTVKMLQEAKQKIQDAIVLIEAVAGPDEYVETYLIDPLKAVAFGDPGVFTECVNLNDLIQEAELDED